MLLLINLTKLSALLSEIQARARRGDGTMSVAPRRLLGSRKSVMKGAVMVEFALVIFILLLAWLGCYGIGSRIRSHVFASNIARVGGQLLYRQCWFRPDPDIPSCMNAVKARIEQYAATVGKKVDVTLTFYRDPRFADPAADPLTLIAPFSFPAVVHRTAGSSKYSTSSFSGVSPQASDMFQKHGRVWVAEVSVDLSDIVTLNSLGMGTAYEVSFS